MFRTFALTNVVFLFTACNRDPEPRRYIEVQTRGTGAIGALTTESPIRITWKLPDGWVEQAGGDPLRIASFLAPDPNLAHSGELDPHAIDVSVTQFSGAAGGVEANISRWMGQLKIPAPLESVKDFIANSDSLFTATGQKGILVDLSNHISGDMTLNNGILGAIFPANGVTVFVKAMGDKGRLAKIQVQFLEFCRGISIADPKP